MTCYAQTPSTPPAPRDECVRVHTTWLSHTTPHVTTACGRRSCAESVTGKRAHAASRAQTRVHTSTPTATGGSQGSRESRGGGKNSAKACLCARAGRVDVRECRAWWKGAPVSRALRCVVPRAESRPRERGTSRCDPWRVPGAESGRADAVSVARDVAIDAGRRIVLTRERVVESSVDASCAHRNPPSGLLLGS